MAKNGSKGPTRRNRHRSPKAQVAVEMYNVLRKEGERTKSNAWWGIALLLLSCEDWESGRWRPFHDAVVYRERNDFKPGQHGPNAGLETAKQLTHYLGRHLTGRPQML